MPFILEPTASISSDLPRVIRQRLRTAIRLLDSMDHDRPAEVDRVVHDVRKRCKEVRAAARLVEDELGSDYDRFDASVHDAADLLAPIRDAYAISGTFDRLAAPADRPDEDDDPDPMHLGVEAVEERVAAARMLLKISRSTAKKWKLPDDFDTLGVGLRATYRRGRKGLRRLEKAPGDDAAHEWRKAVKRLWYQVRLLEGAAPSVLRPYRKKLGDLGEALGDDHDLALLVADLSDDPDRYGGAARADEVRRVALAEQTALRQRAMRLGASLYAEKTDAFVDRLASYWACTRAHGLELPVAVAPTGDDDPVPVRPAGADLDSDAPPTTIERERKYLVGRLPLLPPAGTEMRQGYLAIDGTASVRVRDDGVGDPTLTIKAGHGAVRTELEWRITATEFAAAWQHTDRRRIRKTRYRIPVGDHIAELDVFHDELEGLVLVEVEFTSDRVMAAFSPPDWFAGDVTDDESFTNASLATYALPGQR